MHCGFMGFNECSVQGSDRSSCALGEGMDTMNGNICLPLEDCVLPVCARCHAGASFSGTGFATWYPIEQIQKQMPCTTV